MLEARNANMVLDDLVKESQRVRSMYEQGDELDWTKGHTNSIAARVAAPAPEQGNRYVP